VIDPKRVALQAEQAAMHQQQVALTINAQAIAILAISHEFEGREALQKVCSEFLLRCFAGSVTPVGEYDGKH
jgi:hypothetical protein